MADIEKIEVRIRTGPDANADNDQPVYLGICGREFLLHNTSGDPFERGKTDTFVLGMDSTVKEPKLNDPRNPPLELEGVQLPAYIRSVGEFWQVEDINVRVYQGRGGGPALYAEFGEPWSFGGIGPPPRMWLGSTCGTVLHLWRSR